MGLSLPLQSNAPPPPSVAAQPDSIRSWAKLSAELAAVALAYFIVAKGGLALASLNPSATPIWPPTGIALAALLLRGNRLFPAIFAAALLVNVTTAGTILSSSAIALGNTLEALIGAHLIRRYADGTDAFSTPANTMRFALITLLISTPVSATIGVATLSATGLSEWRGFGSVWVTWWLGDFAGALIVAPVLILYAVNPARMLPDGHGRRNAALAFASAALVGLFVFAPFPRIGLEHGPWGFLALLPLIWAAMRCGPRETALVSLVLSAFAVWGAALGAGPFTRPDPNESFLMLIMFSISVSVPSLVLSAEVIARRRVERDLRRTQAELKAKVRKRNASLTQARDVLHQSQKMEALGQLTGGVAHDFNNLLTPILNGLDLANSRMADDARMALILSNALQAAERATTLTRRMLDFARQHQLSPTATDCAALVRGMGGLLRSAVGSSIAIEFRFPDRLSAVTVDPNQLELALLNLVANARDAMQAGGRIIIGAQEERIAEASGAIKPGNYVCLSVTDTGQGMDDATLARAAEPFFTTKELGKGTGLGLAMVHGFAKQSDGRLVLKSRVGQGTSVEIWLPCGASV